MAALKAAMDVGISRIIDESDSTSLVSAIQTSKFDQAPGGVFSGRFVRCLLYILFLCKLFMFTIGVHTSCSQPLMTGNQFGSIRLTGFTIQ